MVEPLLYAGLGFLVACLVFLFLARALWVRAVRLTTDRLLRRLPTSRAAIVAEQDFVRAEAALAIHAVERRIGRLEDEAGVARADLGRRDVLLARLHGDLAEARTGAAIAEAMRGEIDELRTERAAARTARTAAEAGLERQTAKLVRAEKEAAELHALVDVQRVELAVLKTDLANAQTAPGGVAHEDAAGIAALRTGPLPRVATDGGPGLQRRIAVLEADLLAPHSAEHEPDMAAVADRAKLRTRIEQLAAEIARQSTPRDAAPPVRPAPRRTAVVADGQG